MGPWNKLRHKCVFFTAAVMFAPAMGQLASLPATAQTVRALPPAECKEVRQALEDGVPIGPGFRVMEFEFPANDLGIKGRLCRIQTVGSGAHVEGQQIRALADMHAYVRAALEQSGWRETDETKKFTERTAAGKDVFALYKNNAICVATTLINTAPGYEPTTDVKDNGRIYLGALYPYEREWWLAVDCFHL